MRVSSALMAPAAPDSFPLPDTAVSAERDEDCNRAEARVKAGLALDGDEPEKIIERLTKFGASAAFVEVTAEA